MLATDELKALNTDIEDLAGVELEIRGRVALTDPTKHQCQLSKSSSC